MANRGVVRAAAAVATGTGCVLIAVGLGPSPDHLPASRPGSGEQPVPVAAAGWVSAEGTGDPGGPLLAGDHDGGAVTYLMFEVPAGAADLDQPPAVRLELTRAGDDPLPALVELVEVPDTRWTAEELSWEAPPALGPVVQTVRPAPGDDRVTFEIPGARAGGGAPGILAFAVTVPPDRGMATFAGTAGAAPPTLYLPAPADPTPTPSDAYPVALPSSAPTAPASPTPTPSARPSPSAPPSPSASASASPSPSPSPSPSASASPSQSPSLSPSASPSPSPGPPGAAPECVLGEALVPTCGALWGVAPAAHTSTPRAEGLAEFEADTGRRQDIYHAYHRAEQMFPTQEEVEIAAGGRILFLNWKPMRWSWARIAGGDPGVDSYLDRLADHISATFTDPFFFTVHHEPENNVRPSAGSGWEATDYAAMFRYVVEGLRERGVDNLVTVMNHMAYVHWNAQPWFTDLYPGDDVVDWFAWDTYAYSDPGYGHGDFAEMVNRRSDRYPDWPGFYTWAAEQVPDKPFMLAEWGVWHSRNNPDHMAALYESAARQAPLFPRVKAFVYFDTPADQRNRDSRPIATGAGQEAYQRLGERPHFQVELSPGGDYGR